MASKEGLPYLGSLPIDSELVTLLDAAQPAEEAEITTEEQLDGIRQYSFELLQRYKKTSSSKLFGPIAAQMMRALSTRAVTE